MTLRATVYSINADGVPRDRTVRERNDLDREWFRNAVEREMRNNCELRDGERIEFGPIGEPWGVL